MIERHLMKLRARHEISAEEEQVVRSLVSDVKEHPADTTFVHANTRLEHSTILIDGLLCRYKDLNGGERQIQELHVAGDFADIHSFTLKRLDHNLMTLTPCRVAIVPHQRLRDMTERYPYLARVYWFSTNLDAAIHREWELSLGRRSAIARMANLFCELQVRLQIVGLADATEYPLPLTQADLSECLGLTPVHVNRTLQALRGQGLLEFRGGKVTITDLAGLRAVAEFDPNYLYLDAVDLR